MVEESDEDRRSLKQRSFQSRETVTRMRQPKHQGLGTKVRVVGDSGTWKYYTNEAQVTMLFLLRIVMKTRRISSKSFGYSVAGHSLLDRSRRKLAGMHGWCDVNLPAQVPSRAGRGNNCLVKWTRTDQATCY